MAVGHKKVETTVELNFLQRKPFQYDVKARNLTSMDGGPGQSQ